MKNRSEVYVYTGEAGKELLNTVMPILLQRSLSIVIFCDEEEMASYLSREGVKEVCLLVLIREKLPISRQVVLVSRLRSFKTVFRLVVIKENCTIGESDAMSCGGANLVLSNQEGPDELMYRII